MNITEACQRACQEPTLEAALAWVAVWETERAVQQALEWQRTGVRTGAGGAAWDTCFKVLFERVLTEWFNGEAPLGARPIKVVRPMTVKVTKPKPTPKLNCEGCKAELEFDFDDLVSRYFEGDYTENGPPGVGVQCPECATVTQYRQAPQALVEKVMAREKKAKERVE